MGENPWEKAEKNMEKDGKNTEKPWANHGKNGDIVDRSWEYRGMTCFFKYGYPWLPSPRLYLRQNPQ